MGLGSFLERVSLSETMNSFYLRALDQASLVAQAVKNPPAMWETQVLSLGREDYPREENGYPLQYSCLENCTDRGAW